jgi:hypothetical protein
MIDKIKIMVALVAAAIVIGGGGGLNSCTVEPSVESPSEKPAEYLPAGMPSEVAVYGPIISLDGETRVIKYTVKADFPAIEDTEGGEDETVNGLEYKTTNGGTFKADFVIDAPAQSIEALILQYGTQAAGSNGFSPDGLFADDITELDPAVSGGSYALNAGGFVIIPLDTEEIKKQLTIVLSANIASAVQTMPQNTPLIWIEDNQNGIGTVEKINTPLWGAGTYASDGIRIGGLSKGGSIDTTGSIASNVANFDEGNTVEKNQPRSIATVLAGGGSSTINFYDATRATGLIGTDTDPVTFDSGSVSGGSLGLGSGEAVRKWMEKEGALKPAVRIIYEWKEQE